MPVNSPRPVPPNGLYPPPGGFNELPRKRATTGPGAPRAGTVPPTQTSPNSGNTAGTPFPSPIATVPQQPTESFPPPPSSSSGYDTYGYDLHDIHDVMSGYHKRTLNDLKDGVTHDAFRRAEVVHDKLDTAEKFATDPEHVSTIQRYRAFMNDGFGKPAVSRPQPTSGSPSPNATIPQRPPSVVSGVGAQSGVRPEFQSDVDRLRSSRLGAGQAIGALPQSIPAGGNQVPLPKPFGATLNSRGGYNTPNFNTYTTPQGTVAGGLPWTVGFGNSLVAANNLQQARNLYSPSDNKQLQLSRLSQAAGAQGQSGASVPQQAPKLSETSAYYRSPDSPWFTPVAGSKEVGVAPSPTGDGRSILMGRGAAQRLSELAADMNVPLTSPAALRKLDGEAGWRNATEANQQANTVRGADGMTRRQREDHKRDLMVLNRAENYGVGSRNPVVEDAAKRVAARQTANLDAYQKGVAENSGPANALGGFKSHNEMALAAEKYANTPTGKALAKVIAGTYVPWKDGGHVDVNKFLDQNLAHSTDIEDLQGMNAFLRMNPTVGTNSGINQETLDALHARIPARIAELKAGNKATATPTAKPVPPAQKKRIPPMPSDEPRSSE